MTWMISTIVFSSLIAIGIIIGLLLTRIELKQELKADITKDDMLLLEKRIQDFYATNNIPSNPTLDDIALVFHVHRGEEGDIPVQADLSKPDINGNRVVTFKIGLSEQKKTFAFAHECGHLINGDSIEEHHTRPDTTGKDYKEQKADYTASAIILPVKMMRRFLEENDYNKVGKYKRLRLVKKLSREHNIEDIVVIRRIKEIQLLGE